MKYSDETIRQLSKYYGIEKINSLTCIDTSHGQDDKRENWILDNKYVLRINSAKIMTESRLNNLNRLIDRYREFGIRAPKFIQNIEGKYITFINEDIYYCSEYLDMEIAEKSDKLIKQRQEMVAAFSQKYKGVDLIETRSMYSLFDLSPYDKLIGIDQKQQNFNILYNNLIDVKANQLGQKLYFHYEKWRKDLLVYYKNLPECVYQGDENFSNICVDESGDLAGLFDFNMAGTDVIANYLANLVLQGNFYYVDEIVLNYQAKDIFDKIIKSFEESDKIIKKYYAFSKREYDAYLTCLKIVMISGYVNERAFSYYLQKPESKEKIMEIIDLIIDYKF